MSHYKKAQFFQQKPDNIDEKKFNAFDMVVVDNFSLNDGMLINAVRKIHTYIRPDGYLAINTANPLNSKVKVDIKKPAGIDINKFRAYCIKINKVHSDEA